jgi:pSer/pThr/pTyr-binding forkhead associated (FHA) protein
MFISRAEQTMTVVLKVRDGERFRDVCRLESGRPIIIGRLPQSDAAFPGDFEMSGRHLSLTLLPDLTCRFCDPGSTNGTFVNEQRETEGVSDVV